MVRSRRPACNGPRCWPRGWEDRWRWTSARSKSLPAARSSWRPGRDCRRRPNCSSSLECPSVSASRDAFWMRILSAVLEWSVFLLLLPVLLLHPRVRQGIRRRLGWYERDLFRGPGPRVWLHGASAGDVLGLVPIVRELKRLRPDARVLISAITDSGASMAEQRLIALGLADAVTYLPYDLPGACRRAIAALHPDVLVLEYTELWPQLIHAAARAGVRLAMTNGRISPGNLTRYRALFAV